MAWDFIMVLKKILPFNYATGRQEVLVSRLQRNNFADRMFAEFPLVVLKGVLHTDMSHSLNSLKGVI